jgi:hypothetical protein
MSSQSTTGAGLESRLRRVTAPDYLAALGDADAARIRAMRDECRAEERRLSYVRRVLQGHLDLARAEVARRRGEPPAPLVTRVAHALMGPAGGPRSARAVGLYEPSEGTDDIAIDVETARLPDLEDAALAALVERLYQRERALSDQRGVLLAHLDRLQEALAARYRDGDVAIDEVASSLLASASEPAGGDLRVRASASEPAGGDLL